MSSRNAFGDRAQQVVGTTTTMFVPARRSGSPTSHTTAETAAALGTTLGVAAACWVVSLRRMSGMDMGVATEVGSFGFFVPLWATMMAAMMLPGAAPAVLRRVHTSGRLSSASIFLASYLGVWTVAGIAVFALYRPHGALAAGLITMMVGFYELTPVKRHFRGCCRESDHSGFQYGLYCVGSSVGLMLMFVALGVMSVVWMFVIAVLVLAQKLARPRALMDIPVALAIVGLGVLIAVAPSSVPGLMPPM